MSAAAPGSEAAPAPTAPPVPAPGGGNGATPPAAPEASWRDKLPVEMRNDPTLGRYKTEADLARAFIERNELIGKKGIIPPGKDAKPEEIAAFHEALGVPKNSDGYELADWRPPEGLPWNGELVPKMLDQFREAGIPKEAARKIIDGYAKIQGEAYQSTLTEMGTPARRPMPTCTANGDAPTTRSSLPRSGPTRRIREIRPRRPALSCSPTAPRWLSTR